MHCRWTGKNRLQTYIWVDVKMLTNYAYFGDVVSFDTTFGTNKESRPFWCICWVQSFQGNSGFWCCSHV
jgi:zinc finger SWIM domain-containing protein 3